jgi:hypothetical protein
VLAWKRAHPAYADLPDPIWLHCVLYEETLARRRTGHILFERLELPQPHRLSGNIVVRVENWESFNRIHDTSLNLAPAGENPLAVWRGDRSDTRADHALALLRALNVPVWAFVDFDPSGLLIAAGLPRLAGILAPEPERLERDLAQGLRERYEAQLPMAAAALDASTSEPVQRLWTILRRHGRALPQERYLIAPSVPIVDEVTRPG